MFSNQSVRVHELSRPWAPTAHGSLPMDLYFCVMVMSSAQVFGIWKPFCWKDVGLYQITLFEFAFATTP
jgi:hypothetical protein